MVCGWYPLSANVAASSGLTWMVSSHGVRHVCPDALTSAAGGSDSNRNAAVGGDDLRKSRLGIAEHEAKVKPHVTTAMTLLMTLIPPIHLHGQRTA
jgi:hypothetical protein